jgi:hypothetical protein
MSKARLGASRELGFRLSDQRTVKLGHLGQLKSSKPEGSDLQPHFR